MYGEHREIGSKISKEGDLEKTTYISKPKPCVDEAGCEHCKALFGMSRISERLECRDRCPGIPSEVHHNIQMTCLKKEQASVKLVL